MDMRRQTLEEILTKVKRKARAFGYQRFDDGVGSSNSPAKLAALGLERLPGAKDRPTPLHGLSVLDLGCNEGFFCMEAVRQGATRVVGIDRVPDRIESARSRCPEATFIAGSWWDIPDERFDVILFLSAIHYEPQQKKLLNKLLDHLTPRGRLVLECGVSGGHDVRQWRTVRRSDKVRSFPSAGMLYSDLLSGYAPRRVGKSVKQRGDPVPRFVFHCAPRFSTAIIIASAPGTGKSTVSRQFSDAGIPIYASDILFHRLLTDTNEAWRPVAKAIRDVWSEGMRGWGPVAKRILEDDALAKEFVDIVAAEVPAEADVFIIEGEVFRHEKICARLAQKLRKRHVKPWIMSPVSSRGVVWPHAAAAENAADEAPEALEVGVAFESEC
jgi:SAM-dependent methyltransferase